jgi:hypothetical protein
MIPGNCPRLEPQPAQSQLSTHFEALSTHFMATRPSDTLSNRIRSVYSIGMRIFVFISAKDQDVLGFTADQVGANLPREYAPWTAAAEGGAVLVHDAENEPDADIVLSGVRRDGFFMAVGGCEDELPPLWLRAVEPHPIHYDLLPSLLVH